MAGIATVKSSGKVIGRQGMTRPTDCSEHAHISPNNYVEGAYWMEEMAKTHEQVFCDECQRWAIWRPRPKGTAMIQKEMSTLISVHRHRKNISVNQMCGALYNLGHPIPRWSYYKLEQGKRRIDLDDFVAICTVLRLNPLGLLAIALSRTTNGDVSGNLPPPNRGEDSINPGEPGPIHERASGADSVTWSTWSG